MRVVSVKVKDKRSLSYLGEETYCVLAEKSGIKVKNIIAKGTKDVVKASWFIKCINEKKFIPW